MDGSGYILMGVNALGCRIGNGELKFAMTQCFTPVQRFATTEEACQCQGRELVVVPYVPES